MKMKTVPAMTVLTTEIKTSMKTLLADVADKHRQVFTQAIAAGLHPTGPQFWMYKWESAAPNPESEFLLNICLPVATFGIEYKNELFYLMQVPEFNCVAAEHIGSWANLSQTYAGLFQNVFAQALKPGNICREVYLNCDFVNVANNITDVQIQIV